MQRSQQAFISTELSQQPLKEKKVEKIIILYDFLAKISAKLYEYLQQLNAAHAQWWIALETWNTAKFTYFQIAIDAVSRLNRWRFGTKAATTCYTFSRSLGIVACYIANFTVTHQTNFLTESFPFGCWLLFSHLIWRNVCAVIVVVYLWIGVLKQHLYRFFFGYVKKIEREKD